MVNATAMEGDAKREEKEAAISQEYTENEATDCEVADNEAIEILIEENGEITTPTAHAQTSEEIPTASASTKHPLARKRNTKQVARLLAGKATNESVRVSRLMQSHRPSGWFSLTEARYMAWVFAEVEKKLTLYEQVWARVPEGLLRLDRYSWEAQLSAVLELEGEQFQERVSEVIIIILVVMDTIIMHGCKVGAERVFIMNYYYNNCTLAGVVQSCIKTYAYTNLT